MSLGPFHLSYLNWMQLLTSEDNIHAVCSKCACTVVSRVRIHSWFHARYLYSSSARLSFCPFICPSHSSTVSRRLNISSKLFNSRIASSFVLCDQISERNSNGFTPKILWFLAKSCCISEMVQERNIVTMEDYFVIVSLPAWFRWRSHWVILKVFYSCSKLFWI